MLQILDRPFTRQYETRDLYMFQSNIGLTCSIKVMMLISIDTVTNTIKTRGLELPILALLHLCLSIIFSCNPSNPQLAPNGFLPFIYSVSSI